jgi:hypothetical protein
VDTDTVLSVRISKATKEKMKGASIDWPDYLRQAIDQKLKELHRKQVAESMDTIRAKTLPGKFIL